MDILVTSGTWYPERNGVARVATEVARRLAQRGHAVTALVPLAPGLPAEEREGSLVVRRVIERGRLPLTIKDVLETRRHARGLGRFDVALAHGSMTAVGLARARLPAPLVLAFHASHARELRFTRPRLRWGRDRLVTYLNEPITLALENAAVRRSVQILVLSEYSGRLIATHHPKQLNKVRAVSGGVDVDWFCPEDGRQAARERLGLDRAQRLLVAVRRAEPRLGLDRLLRAVASLDEGDTVALAVIGGGLSTDELVPVEQRTGARRPSALRRTRGGERAAGLVSRCRPRRAPDRRLRGLRDGHSRSARGRHTGRRHPGGCDAGAPPSRSIRALLAAGSDPDALAAAIRNAFTFADAEFGGRCRAYAAARFDWNRVIVGWRTPSRTPR